MENKAFFIICCLLVTGCTLVSLQPTEKVDPPAPTAQPTMSGLPNPASEYCEQQGFTSEIRTASDGSQSGVCIFTDGSECDEWSFYRHECAPATPPASMHNPASAFCEQQGYTLEIRTAPDGSQAGFCIFPDGSECDEWAYFRGECQPAVEVLPTESAAGTGLRWVTYLDQNMGYSFQYPTGAQLTLNDDPLAGLYVYGTSLGTETWSIYHPQDRPEYRPPEGVVLSQWLTDHNLVGETQLPDIQIAGTTAIHYRHERSPQSYAADYIYFARDGQLYQIIIGHAGDTEDWQLDNSFLQSFTFTEISSSDGSPTPIPTALPIDPVGYQDWLTYTNPSYGFTFRLPDDWIVEEVSNAGPGMDGHIIIIRPVDQFNQQSIRLTFRHIGEEVLLWPTGVGQGEFISQGTLEIDGLPAQRLLLVCPAGEVTSIWYHQAEDQPDIQRGNLEFGIIYRSTSTHCEPGLSLSSKDQLVGEMIVASLAVP